MPAGTFTLSIDGTSGGLSKSATVSLKVTNGKWMCGAGTVSQRAVSFLRVALSLLLADLGRTQK
jgi:hypothetical protein